MIYFIITIFTALIGCFIYKGYKNTHSVAINHIKLGKVIPSTNSASLRVLHISDMHIEHISITPEQLFADLKDQSIDLIALTGDFLDRKRSIPKLVPYLEALNKLNPVYGSYVVFGNHDYVLRDVNFNQLKELLNEYGFKTMQNEHKSIEVDGKSLNIIGIDDFSTSRSNIDKSYKEIRKGYNLVLTHDPNIVLKMSDHHFDYLLSGHFHGGQIHWPKPYHLVKMGELVQKSIIKGLHYQDGRPFYISEGLGQTGINIRVGSRPEITYHDLQLYAEAEKDNVELKEATIAG
ncbi:metallophosphoesterase [Oceanobacillus jeddahense]|uniref:Metallophosphoesterase n=1 Tax=Oceanobacillus jeddahense TaxID=1462527 RepID=A0ABY5JX74_9BACI|nr:metallophosphoesterase [Oceanobacillus jeddahense]UUI04993.1 metallophosphoesterase [Oceanobacillus jeddahense]